MRATINGLRIAIVALGFYWLLLFIGTHLPPNRIMAQVHHNDKLLHCLAFSGLSFLMCWAVPTVQAQLYRNTLTGGAICIIYAAIDELLQIPVGRTADWFDFFADCVGVGIGMTVYTVLRAVLLKSQWNLLR
jgi:VanZ family protein